MLAGNNCLGFHSYDGGFHSAASSTVLQTAHHHSFLKIVELRRPHKLVRKLAQAECSDFEKELIDPW